MQVINNYPPYPGVRQIRIVSDSVYHETAMEST